MACTDSAHPYHTSASGPYPFHHSQQHSWLEALLQVRKVAAVHRDYQNYPDDGASAFEAVASAVDEGRHSDAHPASAKGSGLVEGSVKNGA